MTRKQITPRPSENCLCGSSKKFRDCCKSRLPGFAKTSAWRAHAHEGDWRKALLHLRAEITQYSIWHNTNTAPMIGKIPIKEFKFLEIDINALNSQIPDLMRCYLNLNRANEISAALERLRSNINDPRWQRKITYHQCLALLFQDDRESARREFKKLGSIGDDETDIEILQLYIDLEGDQLGLMEKIKLCDRIVGLSDVRSDMMQYLGIKAIEMIMVSDASNAKFVLKKAIEEARNSEEEKSFNPHEQVLYCRLLEGLAAIEGDNNLYGEISRRLNSDLKRTYWTSTGEAQIYRSIGDANRHSGNLDDAISAYKSGRSLEESGIQDVFRAECLVRQKKEDEAFTILDGLDTTSFDKAELADYAFCYACAAVISGKEPKLVKAENLLKDCKPVRMYFDQMRLRYLLQVKEKTENAKRETPAKRRGLIAKIMNPLSRYALLQPNLFGIGINFNAVIDEHAGDDDQF